MKKILAFFIAVTLATTFGAVSVLATEGNTLDDILNSSSSQVSSSEDAQSSSNESKAESSSKSESSSTSDREQKDKDFMSNLAKATDLSGEAEGIAKATSGFQKLAAFVIQFIAYVVVVLLALRVALDLAYIGLPFSRKWLGNGYMGNAQIGGEPAAGGMGGGMGGMGGMGMGGMGGMGGYGMNRGMGMGGMGMGGMGMGGMGMGGQQAGMGGPMNHDQQQMMGKVQWISNAALNAVAAENAPSPDGVQRGPFKSYLKDMFFVLVLIPVLLALALSGALTQLGFLFGDLISDFLKNVGNMV